MFSRPKHSRNTRHLFVGNCGPAAGLPASEVLRIFREFGEPTLDGVSTEARHLFVTYPTESSAAAAVAALRGKPVFDGRVMTIKFAEAGKLRQEPVKPQPAVRDAETCGIPGLTLILEFVSPAEEQALMDAVAGGPWETLARRRVQHFGHRFEYETRGVGDTPAPPMPQALLPVLQRLLELPGLDNLDQATVNEYPPGVGLSPHIDTHSAFTGAIVSLSLGGPAVMDFRRGTQQRSLFLPPRSLLVLAGESRYAWAHYIPHRKSDVVEGQTIQRESPRLSVTLRQVRRRPCDCSYPDDCDSQLSTLPPTRKAATAAAAAAVAAASASAASAASPEGGANSGTEPSPNASCSTPRADPDTQAASNSHPESWVGGHTGPNAAASTCGDDRSRGCAATEAQGGEAGGNAGTEPQGGQSEAALQQLEDQMVNGVYNAIAPHFSATRFAIWPRVREFIESLPAGAVVADVGCGNGKYFGVRRDIAVLGSDRSSGLAHVAAQRLKPESASGTVPLADVAVADGFNLPYRSASCDAVLCIAVLHHMSSPARRVRLLQELLRVIRPGGRALVTVWAEEQEDMKKLAKWQPLADVASRISSTSAATTMPYVQGQEAEPAVSDNATGCRAGLAEGEGADAGVDGSANSGRDFLVPWHVPLHRAEAAAAASAALAAEGDPTGGWRPESSGQVDEGAGNSEGVVSGNRSGVAVGTVNREKGTVVFQRYYHLFREQELRELAWQVKGAGIIETFFDKSNWCLVLGKA